VTFLVVAMVVEKKEGGVAGAMDKAREAARKRNR
jgi:hypothetical protein